MRRLSANELEALINSGNPETLRLVEQYLKDPLNTFCPRPDRLDIPYPDQQSSFFAEQFPGVAVLLGGNRCLSGDTEIYDPIENSTRRLDRIEGGFHVESLNLETGAIEAAPSCKPFIKGFDDLFRVTLSNGESFKCSAYHQLLTVEHGFVSLARIASLTLRYGACPLAKCWDIYPPMCQQGADRWSRKPLNSRGGYQRGRRLCGAQPQSVLDIDQASARLLADAAAHSQRGLRLGARGRAVERSHVYQSWCRPANYRVFHHDYQTCAFENRASWSLSTQASPLCGLGSSMQTVGQGVPQFLGSSNRQLRTIAAYPQRDNLSDSSLPYSNSPYESIEIHSIEYAGRKFIWDITTEPHHNYRLAGAIHHNSGKSFSAGAKIANFLVNTPPPVDRAISLVVCKELPQAGMLWREYISKYLGQASGENHVEHIRFHDPKKGDPLWVTLKPHANGNRHLIHFKSFTQGWQSFSGYNYLGFWADEPCDWQVLTEIVRGCSNWNAPGGQIYTLTPKNINQPELEELYYNQSEHPDFKFYALNTECNDQLNDDYLRKIKAANPRDMWPTLLYGAFQQLSGAIFKEFDAQKHVVAPNQAPIPSNWHRFRALDTGGSEEHPTVLLHGARSPEGDRWIVYNEKVWTTEPPSQIAAEINGLPSHVWDQSNRHYKLTYCDPENKPFRNELHASGIPTTAARKGPGDVLPGINCIRGYLLDGDDGKPRLQVWDTCQRLVKEMRSYRWQSGNTKAHRKPILAPVKFDDDAVDALRYLIFSSERKSSLGEIKILPKPDNRRAIFGR